MSNNLHLALFCILSVCNLVHTQSGPRLVTVPENTKSQTYSTSGRCEETELSFEFCNAGFRRLNSDFVSSPNISCLNFEGNEIVYVSPSAFRLLPNLLHLNLARNNISLADFAQLQKHLNLRTLNLDENSFLSEDNAILNFENDFPRLNYLHLHGNEIREVKSLAFAPKLIYLNLSSNQLGDSDLSFFDKAPASLANLDLSDNQIRSFNASKLPQVRELQLNDNRIVSVCGESNCEDSSLELKGATGLHRLALAGNKLTSLEPDAFEDTADLRQLDLSRNQIESLPEGVFDATPELNNLTMRKNLLSEIPDLSSCKSLVYLSLSHNRLEVVKNRTLDYNINLKFVDLSYNKIRIVEINAFFRLKNLEFLDLSNNQLTSFADWWLFPLINLRLLHVNANRLSQLDDLKLHLIRSSARLEQVYLQDNLISKFYTHSLNDAFRYLPNMTLEFFTIGDGKYDAEAQKAADCHCESEENNEVSLDFF